MVDSHSACPRQPGRRDRDRARPLRRDQVSSRTSPCRRARSSPRARPDRPSRPCSSRGTRCSDNWPTRPEQRGLRDQVRVWRRHDQLRLGLLFFRYHATWQCARTDRAGSGRPPAGPSARRRRVRHRLQLPGQLDGLAGPPSRRGARDLRGGEPLDLIPTGTRRRRDDEPIVTKRVVTDAHAPGDGLDHRRALVQDFDALSTQTIVAEGQALDRAHAAQHQVRERARRRTPCSARAG